MKIPSRHLLAIIAAITVFSLLVWLTAVMPRHFEFIAPGVVFTFLIVFTTTFGILTGGGTVSLLPMITLAAYLALGAIPAAWAAFIGAFVHQVVRYRFADRLDVRRLPSRIRVVALSSVNASIQTVSILFGGQVFSWMGAQVPLTAVSGRNALPLILLGVAYLGSNLFLAGIYMAARGREVFQAYWKSLSNLVVYEAGPMIFAPLVALIYTRLGFLMFISFSGVIIAASLIAWNLSLTSRRLQRRVRELDGLQAVGQALSASLRLDEILPAIYSQVSALMPAHNFYVALYDPEKDDVSFPFAVEDGQIVRWRSRRAGEGLTEYLLKTQKPLLLESNVEENLQGLGIPQVGRPAASWVGVPILWGSQSLGVLAVQSSDAPSVYDRSHLEILVTIAAQAAVAIQNARLYEQTDEALARRVQELVSILRTTTEGILLLNTEWQVLAVNRALSDFLGVAQTEFVGGDQEDVFLDRSPNLLSSIGYTVESLQADCQVLSDSRGRERTKIISVSGSTDLQIERTLTPVRDRSDNITGWLLVFRDLTEEIELARLREDLAHMLIHDLRTPLTSLKGSLWVLKQELSAAENQYLPEMVAMAERNVDRMVGMVNSLLDIAKLEAGEMPLNLEQVDIEALLDDLSTRLGGLAKNVNIGLETQCASPLSLVTVDPEHLRRVLTNIIDNALKFTPDGGKVRLWACPDEANIEDVLIGVSDTGPGIPKSAQAKLFQKFQQVPEIEGRRKGTGLGLAYCRLVIEAHGGQIWVESEEGQGATFIIRLPVDGGDRKQKQVSV